jgi:outer membrane lipase/esterase
MSKFRLSLVAGAVAAALSAGPAGAQFSNTFIFGDSLSDAGQFGARFTTNPGLTAAMYVGERYGLSSSPSFTGGNDYAIGGARVNTIDPALPSTLPYQTIAQQVTAFIAKGPLDSNALYQIQGGGNDFLALLGQFQTGQITQSQLQAGLAQAAADLATQVGRLQAAGARYIVVQGLPDPGKSPLATSPALAAQLTALGDLFNSTLNATMNAGGLNAIRFNYAGLQREVFANPTLYGFTNTTGSACTVSNLLLCTPSTLAAPNAAQTYVLANPVHPTTGFHQLVAQAIESMINGPAQMASLAEAPLAVEQAQFRALDGRMWSALDTPATNKTLQSWVAYDYSAPDVGGNAFLSGDGSMNSVALGLDMRISPSVLVGVAFGYSQNKVDFGNSTGGFTLDETSMTFYGGWGSGPWYMGGSLLLGNLDYNDVHRNITLGTATRTENADTSGWHYAIRALGGYWFKSPNLIHGPFGKVVWQEASVNNFSETSSSSTSLSYAKQDRESLQTSLGWQLQGTWGSVRPFGRATWEYEAKADDRSVTASSVTLGGSYSVPAYKPDNNWGLFVLGASSDFGGVTGYLMGTATAGKGDGDAYSVTLGIRVPL